MIAARRPWIVPALGLAAALVFLGLIARFWHPVYGLTALIQLDTPSAARAIPEFHQYPVYVHPGTEGYDGLYYAQLAYDPSLHNPALPAAMDNFAYRARRILPAALAWLAAAGQPAHIVGVYATLNLVAWLVLALILWRLLAVRDARGLLAWAGVMFSSGALASVRLALTDLIALTIIAGGMLAAERGSPRWSTGFLAAAALARETALVAVVTLWERPWISRRNALRALAAGLPLALWIAYVRLHVPPDDAGWGNFTLPVAGLIEKWQASIAAMSTMGDRVLAATTLLATLALTVQAAWFLSRWQPEDRWWRLGLASALLLLCLGTAVWEGFPGAATRVLLPLTLAFNVSVYRSGTRAALAWLLVGNLTVFAGLLALRDVPHDDRELAAVRTSGVASIARLGEGWYSVERHGAHRWTWTSGRGTVDFVSWPRQPRTVRLEFSLRSLTPRTVVVRQNGRELGRFQATPVLSSGAVTVEPAAGGPLEFTTETPPVREAADPGARALAFALYDPHLSVPEP